MASENTNLFCMVRSLGRERTKYITKPFPTAASKEGSHAVIQYQSLMLKLKGQRKSE